MITLLNKFDDGYLIHEKDALEIIAHYIEEDNLEDYIKDVTFDSTSKYAGSYNLKTRKIVLNDENLLSHCYKIFDKLIKTYQIDEKYYTYFLNFYYLYVLFHEIEHAKQEKKYQLAMGSNLYNFLYELGRKLQNNDLSFYDKNHDLFPMEIDANNNGYLRAYNILSYTKLPGRETKILYLQYLFSLLYNYEKVNNYHILTPIEKLSQENNNIDLEKVFELMDESHLSKIERMNLGVCITPKEFDSIELEKKKILCRKYIIKR